MALGLDCSYEAFPINDQCSWASFEIYNTKRLLVPVSLFQITCLPVTVQTQPVYHTTGTESKRVACFIDYSNKGIGSRYSCQSVFRTVAAMHKVCQITLGKSKSRQRYGKEHISWWAEVIPASQTVVLKHKTETIWRNMNIGCFSSDTGYIN